MSFLANSPFNISGGSPPLGKVGGSPQQSPLGGSSTLQTKPSGSPPPSQLGSSQSQTQLGGSPSLAQLGGNPFLNQLGSSPPNQQAGILQGGSTLLSDSILQILPGVNQSQRQPRGHSSDSKASQSQTGGSFLQGLFGGRTSSSSKLSTFKKVPVPVVGTYLKGQCHEIFGILFIS